MSGSNGGKTTRVAIIGAGFIADTHMHALQELRKRRVLDVDVVAVCDPSTERAASLQRRFGIATHHASVEAMLESDPPDVAHLLVPPPLHVDMCKQLLESGVIPFVEKPMGLSSRECDEVVALAEAKQLPVGVNQNFVYHPAVQELRRLVEANAIGPVQFVTSITNLPLRQLSRRQFGHWMFRQPQNILFELGCHPFSMVHSLLGPVESAMTLTTDTIRIGDDGEFHKSWRTMLDCERGSAQVYLAVGREFPVSRLGVIGPDGSLEADLVTGVVTRGEKTRWIEFYDLTLNDKKNARRMRRSARRNFWGYIGGLTKITARNDVFFVGMRDSIRAFHEAVRDGKTPPISGKTGADIIRYCEAVWDGRPRARRTTPEPVAPETPSPKPGVKPNETVLVTGTTGFIGSHLVEKLVASGRAVRAFVRSSAYLPAWLQHPNVEIVVGSLTNDEHLRQAVQGADSVIHLATGLYDNWHDTERVAVHGTKTFADICREAGVKRFIFTSSIAALYLGGMSPSETVRAEQPTDPKPDGRSIYARAKIACEAMLLKEHRENGLPLVMFRPGLVVGPRGITRHSGVGFWPRDNHCLSWGNGEHPLPFVLAADVADALVASLDRDEAVGKTFNLVGEVRLTGREYVRELTQRCGRPIGFHPQNLWVMQGVELFKWLVKFAVRKPDNVFPSFRDLKTRALRPWFDCSAAREILGWRPESDRDRFLESGLQVPLDQGG